MDHVRLAISLSVAGVSILLALAGVGDASAADQGALKGKDFDLVLTDEFQCLSCVLESTTITEWSRTDFGCNFTHPTAPYKEQYWKEEKYWCLYAVLPSRYDYAYKCSNDDPYYPYFCVSELIPQPTCHSSACLIPPEN